MGVCGWKWEIVSIEGNYMRNFEILTSNGDLCFLVIKKYYTV